MAEKSPYDGLIKFGKRASYLGKQAIQGAMLPWEYNDVVPGQKRKGGMFTPPVAIDMIPAVVGTAIELGSGGKYKPIPYIQRAQQRVANADAYRNEKLGIKPPDDPLEFAANIMGGLLVPGPKIIKASPRSSTGVKVASAVANTAAEAVLPLRQGSGLVKTAAVQVPLGLGLMEGVDAAFKAPEYKSIREVVVGDDPEKTLIAAPDRPLEEFIPPEILPDLAEAEASGDQEWIDEIYSIADEQRQLKAADEYLGDEPDWKDGATTLAVIGGLALGVGGIRQIAKTRANANLAPALDSLTGQRINKPRTGLGTKLSQGSLQHDASIREAGKEIFQGKDYDQFLAKLDSVTAAPLNTKTMHGITTGELPGASSPKAPISTTLEAFASELAPAEQKVVSNALLAQSALDDFQRTGKLSAFTENPRTGRKNTPADLQQYVNAATSDPKLAKYVDSIKQHYRDEIDYRLERGMITPEKHAELIRDRPNFVHMSRNVTEGNDLGLLWRKDTEKFSSNDAVVRTHARSEEEFGGVRMSEAADPIRELPGTFAKTIREAEINSVKSEFLELASSNAALGQHVKKIGTAQPNSMENVHAVLVGGVPHYYKVTDPALASALEFMPFASKGFLSTTLGLPKRLAEFFITGAGAPAFATTSSLYDTLTGIALRPKGYDLGSLAEFKNHMLASGGWKAQAGRFVPAGGILSTFDPTTWVSAPIGAVRLGYDSVIESMANDLSVRLMKDNDWFVQAVGPQNARVLRDRLASVYDSSVKSLMDEYGATTNSYFSSVDPASLARGMANATPKFTNAVSKRAYAEAIEGGASFYEGLLKGGAGAFERARASTIARVYTGTVKLLHEGFRYQAFATNMPKVLGDEDLTRILASQTRRISGDVGQIGGAKAYQEVANSAMYMNVGVQTLAQTGRMIKQQPLTTAANITASMLGFTMLQYLWAASDPANIDELARSTDDENARQIRTFGGVTLPVPPELRLLWGPYSALLNEITGINDGTFDGDIAAALEAWFEDDMYLSEEGQMSLADSWRASWQSATPINVGSNPAINAALAAGGIDVGLSRFTGSTKLIEGQTVSALGGEGKLEGDAISAVQQKMIQDLMGTTVADYMRTALDAHRAIEGGAMGEEAVRVALSRMTDNTVRAAGPLRGLIFGDYEKLQSANDTASKMWYKKREGFEKAKAILDKDLLNQFTTGADERYAMLRSEETLDPSKMHEYQGTALMPIGMIAAELNREIYELERLESELRDQADHTKNERFSSIEERNLQVNAINEERTAVRDQMLNVATRYEEAIRQVIGDPSFTFQNFDPEKYKKMSWALQPPPAAEPLPPAP